MQDIGKFGIAPTIINIVALSRIIVVRNSSRNVFGKSTLFARF